MVWFNSTFNCHYIVVWGSSKSTTRLALITVSVPESSESPVAEAYFENDKCGVPGPVSGYAQPANEFPLVTKASVAERYLT